MRIPLISVVVPAFNAEGTIEKCIESLLNQSVPVYEIIVVNDGSTDSTGIILDRLVGESKQYSISVITQLNSGQAKARNTGIEAARGEWISFLDADDTWLDEKNEEQIKFIDAHPNISLLGTYIYMYDRGSGLIRGYNKEYIQPTFTKMLFKNMFYTSTTMVRRDIVKQYMFNESKRFGEDYFLWLEIVSDHETAVLRKGLVVYADHRPRYNRTSVSSHLWKMERNELEIFFHFFKKGKINIMLLGVVSIFSFLKFILRLVRKMVPKPTFLLI